LIQNFLIEWKEPINVDIDSEINIIFNKKLFNILIKNLVENSIKYNKRGEQIEITYSKKQLIIKNKVSNKNKKIDISKIFDIFYKWDVSRNSNWYWLWLNIVRKIIELHNYKINIKIENNYFIVNLKFF